MATPAGARGARAERVTLFAAIAIWFAALYALGVSRPPFGDEPRFIDIVRTFGARLDLETLRTYPAMTTPLAFLAYAAWGMLAGFEVWQLRLLSPLLAIATCVLFDRVLHAHGARRAARIAGVAVLCVNPYFAGLGVYVFTDMLSLLALVLVMYGVTRARPAIAGMGLAAAMLTRQYDVFVALALAGAVALLPLRRARTWWMAIACSAVPVLACLWLWRGPAPVSVYREELLAAPLRFHPHWLSLYLAAPGIYVAPLVVWQLLRRRPGVAVILAAAFAAAWTLIFPVQPAAIQIAQCCADTGYVHRTLLRLNVPGLAPAAFFVAAAAWIATTLAAIGAWRRRARVTDLAGLFPWLAIAAFLIVMPFSYMPWEKYALPLLLFTILVACVDLSSDVAPPASRQEHGVRGPRQLREDHRSDR